MRENVEAPVQEEEPENQEETWSKELEAELRELKQRQYTAKRKEDFAPADRQRLLLLRDMQERELGIAGLSQEEKDEMRELQKSQLRSTDLTPEKADRLRKLRERMEK